ncbi:MAG: DNA cytosine methyltransferase [Veillonellaceae bacterium]|nr:DNA cytosine methyltransferase [Veillonellaceae bacterium]
MSSRCDGGWPPFPMPQGKPATVREAWAGLDEAANDHVPKWPQPGSKLAECCRGMKPGQRANEFYGRNWGFQLSRLDWDKPAPTLSTGKGASGVVHPAEARKCTPHELKLLASFPSGFRFAGNSSDAEDRIGNTVPPKFAQAIATCIREHILGDRDFTYISLFAGCGGSSLGYKWAGGRGLAAVEFNANAAETYRLNFPETPVLERDIATVTAEELLALTGLQVGDLDILDGSPPCQGFSTAGKRQLDDPRNTLFREYVRLVEGLQPRVFVMENVSGMVKGKMRLVFKTIMETLKATGYTVRCQLLNAMYYGVPQSRERLIWIGVRPDIGPHAGFPPPEGKPKTVGEAVDGDARHETHLTGMAWLMRQRAEGRLGSAV